MEGGGRPRRGPQPILLRALRRRLRCARPWVHRGRLELCVLAGQSRDLRLLSRPLVVAPAAAERCRGDADASCHARGGGRRLRWIAGARAAVTSYVISLDVLHRVIPSHTATYRSRCCTTCHAAANSPAVIICDYLPLQACAWPLLSLRASGSFHDRALHCVLHAPMRFFFKMPLG